MGYTSDDHHTHIMGLRNAYWAYLAYSKKFRVIALNRVCN